MRLASLGWLLFTPVLLAQSRTAIENDKVKVLDVTVQPHEKTRLHQHAMNRVMLYLMAGTQDIDYQDGAKTRLIFKAGEVKWSPLSGMHIAEILSEQPVRIIELELKTPGRAGKMDYGELDPVKVDPKHYRVEMENPQVRVLRVKIGPHESTPMHEHRLDRVVTYLTDQDFRVTGADGKIETPRHRAGEMSTAGMAKHREENLSGEPFEVVVVELK